MKAPLNKIFVTVEKKWEDEIKLESITLYKDTSYAEEWNVRCWGMVHSVPNRVTKDYADAGFHINVQPGDKLYFNFGVLLDNDNLVIEGGQEYWAVDYFQAIALVREGKVIPVGNHILIEPIAEEVTSSVIIIPELAQKKEGNTGKVFASNDPEIPIGAIVEYEDMGKFENEIEGHRLYCMFNHNIHFKYN
jgi:co-chaperonin GroES (HSP10)